jgi:RimJ/RimL family protein N-acetyltransferase
MNYVAEVIKKFAPINGFGVEAAENIEEIAENILNNKDVICIKKDGKGVILGIIYPLFYNPNVLVAQELGWWVEPKYRNTSLGIKLLKEFEAEAKQRGAEKVIMFYLEAQTPTKIKQILQRVGYSPSEYNMVKDL